MWLQLSIQITHNDFSFYSFNEAIFNWIESFSTYIDDTDNFLLWEKYKDKFESIIRIQTNFIYFEECAFFISELLCQMIAAGVVILENKWKLSWFHLFLWMRESDLEWWNSFYVYTTPFWCFHIEMKCRADEKC